MTTYADQYPAIVSALTAKRGSFGGTDSTGAPLPAITTDDMIGLMSLLVPGLVAGIGKGSDVIANVEAVDPDTGVLILPNYNTLTPDAYLSGVPNPGSNWERTAPSGAGGLADVVTTYYVPARKPTFVGDDGAAIVGFMRQAVDDYQACVSVCVAAIGLYPPGTGLQIRADAAQNFLRNYRALCGDIDVLSVAAPANLSDQVVGALKYAAGRSAKAAGQLAAGAANVAGEVVGEAASGFFSSAGVVTLAAAGFLAYRVLA